LNRPLRVLLAWFERKDAVSALLNFRLPEAGDDLRPLEAQYDAARAALAARPPFDEPPPLLEPLPETIAEHGRRIADRMRTATRDEKPPRELDTGVIDLSRVISFQKAVALDALEGRVGAISQDDWTALANLCLPESTAGDDSLRGTFDKDGKGITLTSFNPNLRVTPVQQIPSLSNEAGPAVGFQVIFGLPYLHVVEYRNRVFLKDGYHRAHGLLSRGITRVPCLWERARSFQDVYGGGSTFISQEYILGTHPPLVRDFNDTGVAATVQQQSFRRVIRIRAEEFVVHI
jgi:hypothetical protein